MDKQIADKLDSVSNALHIQNFVDKIEDENAKRTKESSKETKELVSALKDLNKKIGDVGKEKKGGGASKTLSGWFQDKISPIKKLTSLQGITETLAAKAGPGLTGALLGTAAEGMQVRRDEKERKKSFVTTILAGTEQGRSWQKEHGIEKATQMATAKFTEREDLERKIAKLDQTEKLLQGSGEIEGAGLTKEDTIKREELQKQLKENKEFFVNKKSDEKSGEKNKQQEEESPVKKEEESTQRLREELMQGVKEGIQREYESLTPEEKAEFDKNPEERAIMIDAAMEELSKISEDQLRELVRIADALDVSEMESKENMLEAINDTQTENVAEQIEKKSPMKKLLENGMKLFNNGLKGLGSIFSKGLSFLGGGLTKLIGPIAGMMPSLMGALVPAAGVAAAGAAGYMVGTHVVNPLLNNAAEAITGVKDETVGTGIYTAVDNIAGSKLGNMLGFKSDAQKMEESETRSLVEMGNVKIAKGEKVSPTIANAMVKSGIPVLADQIAVPPTKQETRTQITEAVERTADQIDRGPGAKVSTSVVNAPTVVNNSTSNTTITHKPLRNTEESYVSGMNRKLVF